MEGEKLINLQEGKYHNNSFISTNDRWYVLRMKS